jgi:hypothetical protein
MRRRLHFYWAVAQAADQCKYVMLPPAQRAGDQTQDRALEHMDRIGAIQGGFGTRESFSEYPEAGVIKAFKTCELLRSYWGHWR